MDNIENSLYKHHHICTLCQIHYGSDYDNDSGLCPLCEEKQYGRYSKLDKNRPSQTKCRAVGYKKRGGA